MGYRLKYLILATVGLSFAPLSPLSPVSLSPLVVQAQTTQQPSPEETNREKEQPSTILALFTIIKDSMPKL